MPIPFLNSIKLNKNQVEDFCVFNYSGDPTLSSGADFGYLWLNTSATPKVLKFWDGTNYRTLIDSTTISSSTAGTANDLSGGVAGSLPYQQGVGDTTFLGIGTADQVLTVNSGATAPQWTAQSSLSVGSATNKTGGNLGDILVQSGSGTTSFLNAGTAGQVITSNGASPQYVNQSTLSVGSATTATTATNVAGGANGSILVQSGAGTTGQLAIGASGYILTSNGTTPGWSASIPSTSVSGLAASATTDTTNASNISSGTLGLARLSLATGQFYVGDGSNNPAATAKSSIPLSGFGAAGADVAMGGFKITGLADPAAATDAATRGYVDSVAQGLDVKASCLVATTADITLASPGAVTIDGIYSATDFTAGTTRILVKDQSAPAENGIYIWQGPSSAMTRSADADTWDELVGAFTFIERGTANADSGWVCTVNAGGTLGTTAVTWVKFSQAGSYTAGNGIVQSGTSFNFAQSTPYTAGQIPFASSTTAMGFSANLHWDNVNNSLGIGTATPAATLDVRASNGVGAVFLRTTNPAAAVASAYIQSPVSTGFSSTVPIYGFWYQNSGLGNPASDAVSLITGSTERFKIVSDGVCTWSNVGGVAGTAMTLNGTGLGVGVSPNRKLEVAGGSSIPLRLNNTGSNCGIEMLTSSGTTSWLLGAQYNVGNAFEITPSTAVGGTTFSTPAVVVTASGNVGIGTATPGLRLDVVGFGRFQSTTGSSQVVLSNDGGLLNFAIDSSTGGNFGEAYSKNIYCTGAQPLRFWTNGVDRMRIDSTGNVGIGTTTPDTKLHLSGTGNQELKIHTNTSGNPILTLVAAGQDSASILYNRTDNYLSVNVSAITGALRLTTSGNLGLGVTPSAWVGGKAFQLGSAIADASLSGLGDDTNIATNAYYNAGWKYINGGYTAARYRQSGGIHSWFTAPAGGSNGAAITFTQAMTLDASGNLGVGTASPSQMLDVNGNARFRFSSGTGGGFWLDGAVNANRYFFGTESSVNDNFRIYDSVAGTNRLTLDTSGNLLVGTAANLITSTVRLHIEGSQGIVSKSTGGFAYYPLVLWNTATSGDNVFAAFGTEASYTARFSLTYNRTANALSINATEAAGGISLTTGSSVERLRIKSTGQVNFVGLSSDPAGAAGDVYYNSGSNVFKVYDTGWKTLPRKYVVQLSDGSVTVVGNAYTLTHNFASKDVTISIRRTTDDAVVLADVTMPTTNTATVTFASAITAANYYVTVIG